MVFGLGFVLKHGRGSLLEIEVCLRGSAQLVSPKPALVPSEYRADSLTSNAWERGLAPSGAGQSPATPRDLRNVTLGGCRDFEVEFVENAGCGIENLPIDLAIGSDRFRQGN